MIDVCRGTIDTRDALDIITTILTCASLDHKRFQSITNMGANSLCVALDTAVYEQELNFPDAFKNISKLSLLGDQALSHIVYELSACDDLTPFAEAIRETLIDNAGKKIGEFGSSNYITELLPTLIGDVKEKILLDAACGLARLASKIETNVTYLQEKNLSSASIAARLLLIEGKHLVLAIDDSLTNFNYSEKKFDLVVMEPPMGVKVDSQFRSHVQHAPYIIDSNKSIPVSAGDALWVQLALHHLNESGKAYLVLPQGFLFRGGYDASIREHLLNNELVDKVIALPSGSVPGTNIEPVLLVLDKAKEKGSPIRLVDLRDIGTKSRQSTSLNSKDLTFAIKLISGEIDDDKKSRNVTVREIRQTELDNTGNNLNVSHYLQVIEEITLPTMQEQMDSLQQVKQQFEENQKELFTLLNQ